MKQLITTIALFIALQSYSQQDRNEAYFGIHGGIMKQLPAFGMSIGGSIENVSISGKFLIHDQGNQKNLALGYNIRFGQLFSVVPKVGYLWGKTNGSKEESYYGPPTYDTYQYPASGVLISYHINQGSAYMEYFGKSFSIGVRIMSWYNQKSNY